MIVRFLVELARLARLRVVDRGVEALRRKFPALDDQFPGPVDRFLLEVIAEGPVAEHLEKRVVIGVEADVVEVVVLAAGADAFCVSATRGGFTAASVAEEDRHELVHAGVGEQQVRRVRHERRRRHDGVLLLAKEIEKGLADLGGGHEPELSPTFSKTRELPQSFFVSLRAFCSVFLDNRAHLFLW